MLASPPESPPSTSLNRPTQYLKGSPTIFYGFKYSEILLQKEAYYRVSKTISRNIFDNLRRYFCSERCFIGSESRAISRQQTIRQADNSDNNGRWHFLGIIDRSDDDHDDCNDHDDLSLLEWKKLIY